MVRIWIHSSIANPVDHRIYFSVYWVYRDAKDRGEEAILWLIVVLIANFIGLIIWLLVRPEKKTKRKEGLRYCSNCGAEISPKVDYCPECGEEIS